MSRPHPAATANEGVLTGKALLQGLPASRLHAASGADAIVAWNASSLTGIVVWLGSEDKIDWLQDAITFFSGEPPGWLRPGWMRLKGTALLDRVTHPWPVGSGLAFRGGQCTANGVLQGWW